MSADDAPTDCPSTCACACHTEVDDPGEHLPECLWSDPEFGDEDVLDPIDAASLTAVRLVLDLASTDPDVRRVIRPGSELWERLCAAEAALFGRPVEEVLAERAAMTPVGPRRLMTYEEWTRVRAAEVAGEGAVGSHWPDKGDARWPRLLEMSRAYLAEWLDPECSDARLDPITAGWRRAVRAFGAAEERP